MSNEISFDDRIKSLKQEVQSFPETPEKVIEETASRLKGLHYSPPISIDIYLFLRLSKTALLEEIDKILAMSDQEACTLAPDNPGKCRDIRLQTISVLVYYYRQLIRLREGEPEAWEEVDEMYVHD